MITFGSLFAGIGGFDLGLERAGMVCKWQVEIDPFCQKVLAKHWPHVARYGDVREVGKHNLEAVDLICGGFPCQPHSVAGKRKGAEDDRDLWPEYRRVIAELRPRWILAENVSGIITTILDKVLTDLDDLDYTRIPIDIPAIAFDAVHRRRRIFIVAHRKGLVLEKCQVAERKGSKSPFQPGRIHALSHGRIGWSTNQPSMVRVDDGLSDWVDRSRSLGNAVVPQVAEWIGRQIMEVENQ